MEKQLTIKEWRRAKGITLEDMAKKCDVHVNTYRAWEEKPSEIKLSKASIIAEILDITLEDILFMP